MIAECYANWLLVSNPMKNMKVTWDDYSQYIRKIKFMFQNTNQRNKLGYLPTPAVRDRSVFQIPSSDELSQGGDRNRTLEGN